MSLLHGVGAGLGGSGDAGGPLGSFFSTTIDQSLRLDSASGAYLEIAEASPTATDRKKVTISCWVKRSFQAAEVHTVFWSTVNGLMLQFNSSGYIYIYDFNASSFQATTTQLFRDFSAWYHLVLIIDTTQSTAADRAKFYVNGTLIALNSYPGQNDLITWHDGSTMRIGSVGDTQDLAGYIAEFISIDGQDTSISDFGETKDGVWIPKDVSGLTLGNAGFYLPFSQDRTVSASTFFSDSGNSYVEFSNASHYDIGSSDDFTIEFWFWPTVAGSTDYAYVVGNYVGTSGPHMALQFDFRTSNRYFYFYYGNGAADQFQYSTGDVDAGRWHHVAVNRNSGTLELFLDGARVGSAVTSHTREYGNDNFRIGQAQENGSNGFDGYLSNVRMVVGSAVYSSGSSITVPTSPLTAITNTKLLALTTTTITADGSTNNVTGTVSGSGYFATDGLSPFPNAAFNEDAGSNGIDFAAKNVFDYDVVLDSPTNNFSTMNFLYHSSSKGTLSRGALKVSGAGFVNAADGYGAVSTFAIPKDKKIYIEVECTDANGTNWFAGFASQSGLESGPSGTNVGGSNAITVYNRQVYVNGNEINYGGSYGLGGLGSSISKLEAGDILGCMCDGATGKVWFSRNGTYFMSPSTDNSGTTGDPAGGNHEIGTITNGTTEDVFFVIGAGSSAAAIFVNFGQDSQNVASAQSDGEGIGTFEYAPPTDYVSLCSSNLTTPTIGPTQSSQAEDHFNTVLYTGNASSRSITGVGFEPDLVWIKPRNDTDNNVVFDSVRGVQKFLYVNTTGAEGTRSGDGLSSFDSDGFSIGDWNNINENLKTYVSWNWKAGGTANTISADSISSGTPSLAASVSANTDAGFSIVTWTADADSGTVGHGLNSAPEMIIAKPLGSGTNWYVMHTVDGVIPASEVLNLDNEDAKFNPGVNHFNDTYPTDDVFSFGGYLGDDLSNDDKVAYCFHSVEGFSKVGTYNGNVTNYSGGAFIYTGFRPALVMIKSISAGSWVVTDNKRASAFNGDTARLYWNDTAQETAYNSNRNVELFSNGFMVHGNSASSNTNKINEDNDYIYLAFAEAPLKFANAR